MSRGLWHPFTQLRGFSPLGRVVSARGAHLVLDDGRRVLDGISSWWVNLHGHSRPEISASIAAQAATLDQVILADFAHPAAEALQAALLPHLPPGLRRIFFSDDGSTSVEVALKMAWQHQRAQSPRRTRVMAFAGGYHGDTLGAMSVGDRDVFTAAFADLLLPVELLPWGEPEAVERRMAEVGDEVVAVILEPMLQCAGGMRLCSAEALARVGAAVQGAGALLIADEVAVGFGRTGRMWGGDHAGLRPDLLCMSKGLTGGSLPMGLTAATEAIYAGFFGPDKRSAFLHAHSYTGNPIAAAAALASLRLLEAEDTPGIFARYEAVYRGLLPTFAAHPRLADPRCIGGIFAVNVLGGGGYLDPIGQQVQAAALARGVYLRPLGSVVYLMPPACLSAPELEGAVLAVYDALVDVLGPAEA